MVLFGLCFQPGDIEVQSLGEALAMRDAVSPQMAALGQGGIPFVPALYPWRWLRSELDSFRALQGGLLVAPILRQLIFNREPQTVVDWVQRVVRWPFRRIIPAHFANDLQAGPAQFEQAFDFLFEPFPTKQRKNPFLAWATIPFSSPAASSQGYRCPMPRDEDLAALRSASQLLTNGGILKPEAALLPRSSASTISRTGRR